MSNMVNLPIATVRMISAIVYLLGIVTGSGIAYVLLTQPREGSIKSRIQRLCTSIVDTLFGPDSHSAVRYSDRPQATKISMLLTAEQTKEHREACEILAHIETCKCASTVVCSELPRASAKRLLELDRDCVQCYGLVLHSEGWSCNNSRTCAIKWLAEHSEEKENV